MAVAAAVLWACSTFIMYRGFKLAGFGQVFACASGGAVCVLFLAYAIDAPVTDASVAGASWYAGELFGLRQGMGAAQKPKRDRRMPHIERHTD